MILWGMMIDDFVELIRVSKKWFKSQVRMLKKPLRISDWANFLKEPIETYFNNNLQFESIFWDPKWAPQIIVINRLSMIVRLFLDYWLIIFIEPISELAKMIQTAH